MEDNGISGWQERFGAGIELSLLENNHPPLKYREFMIGDDFTITGKYMSEVRLAREILDNLKF